MMPHVYSLPFTAGMLHNTLNVPLGNAAVRKMAAVRDQNM